MRLTEEEIESRLRVAIERRLKRGNGHCQMGIHGLGKSVYMRVGNGHFKVYPDNYQRREIYAVACKLCEEYGGKIDHLTHRANQRYNNAARVYQF